MNFIKLLNKPAALPSGRVFLVLSFELAWLHRHFQLVVQFEIDLFRKSYFQPRMPLG